MAKVFSYIFGGLLLVSLIFGGYNLYTKWQLEDANSQLNQQLMQANLNLGKAHTQFGNAQSEISKLSSELKASLKKNNELIVAYGELEAKYNASNNGSGSGSVEPGEPVEPGEDYISGSWYVATGPKELVKLGGIKLKYSDFRLDISSYARPGKNGEVVSETEYTLHLRFAGQLFQTTTKSGAVNHYFVLSELDPEDNPVGQIELEKFEVVVQNPDSSSFFWWAPHLSLGAFLGARTGQTKLEPFAGATLGFSASGYGLTKNDLIWKFFQFGADLSEDTFAFSFSPAAYNLGQALPLISNLYIAPYFSLTTNLNKSVGLNLTVNL